MISKIALMTLMLASAPALPGSQLEEKMVPRCGGPFQLCGYIQKDSGEVRIPERFEVALPFSEGLAAVRLNGRYGFIDLTGQVVIEPRFEAVGPFTGGYAEVSVDGRSGAIDRAGRMVVQPYFLRLIPFADGTFIAKPLPSVARPVRSAEENFSGLGFHYPLEGLSLMPASGAGGGLYHIRKGWLTDDRLGFSYFDRPSRGLIWAGRSNVHHDAVWGLIKADGTWQVTPRYGHVQVLRETHAVVGGMPDYSVHPLQRKYPLRGAVDRDGKLVVPLKFDNVSYWRGGYGLVSGVSVGPDGQMTMGAKGIVKADGSLLADRFFDEVDIREDGKLPRGRIDSTWYSIEPSGKLVADQLDGALLVDCPGGLKIALKGEMAEFRRADGEVVGQFDKTYFPDGHCPRPFATRRNGKWFFVLQDGTVLGGPAGFDNSYSFSGDHAAVSVDGKWGIIDRSGAFTVKPRFTQLSPVGGGIFSVNDGQRRFWVNGGGVPVEKSALVKPPADELLTCKGGLRFFAVDGRWGLRDAEGKTVIEPEYRALSCFSRGVSWTASDGGDSWCAVGADGRRVDALACRKTYYPMWVSHAYPERFADDDHESSVLWHRAWLDYAAGVRDKAPQWISDGVRGSHSVISQQ